MWKQIACASMAMAATFLLLRAPGRIRTSCPTGLSRDLHWEQRAHSAAQIGARKMAKSWARPKTPEGGWLILDKPLQDVQFASTFRCTGGCRAGVMLRAQSTPEGMQGV